VGSRAAARAKHNAPRPCIERLQHQLAAPDGRGAQRVAKAGRDALKPGRLSHFDERRVLAEPAPGGLAVAPDGVAYGRAAPLAAGCGQHGVARTFTPVDHGQAMHLGGGCRQPYAYCSGSGNLRRTQAILERISRHRDPEAWCYPHAPSLAVVAPASTLRGPPATKASTLSMS